MFDTGKLFDLQFEPIEGGYRYHPWPWSKGYLVTEEEFQLVRTEYLSASSWRFIGLLILGMIAILMLWTITMSSMGLPSEESEWVDYFLGIALVGPIMWRILAPQRLVWGREPIAPRRTMKEQDEYAAVSFGWPMIGFSALAALLWVALGAWVAANGSWWGIAMIIIALPGIFRTWRTIQFKLKSP